MSRRPPPPGPADRGDRLREQLQDFFDRIAARGPAAGAHPPGEDFRRRDVQVEGRPVRFVGCQAPAGPIAYRVARVAVWSLEEYFAANYYEAGPPAYVLPFVGHCPHVGEVMLRFGVGKESGAEAIKSVVSAATRAVFLEVKVRVEVLYPQPGSGLADQPHLLERLTEMILDASPGARG